MVLSVFDIKMVGHPVMHHMKLIHHGDRFMVSSSVDNRNGQEGTKHTVCSYIIAILLSHVFGTETHMLSTWVQHGFGSILFTLAGENACPCILVVLTSKAPPGCTIPM